MANKEVVKILIDNGLRVTPQRIAILEVLLGLDNHPTAETIVEYIRLNHPNISMATVYNCLETYTRKGIINKVRIGEEIMRYDPIHEKHHHLYSSDTERIEDYTDDKLYDLIYKYLKNKKIPNFEVRDIRVQINGRFTDEIQKSTKRK